ncbi:MAG: hypothetical protein JNL01_01860 [Bdellovibrionales bacterium]|nr:hypothetical protein [Bdellovibrionales bacterium]
MIEKKAAEALREIHHLMSLKGENPFKIRAFEKAADIIEGRTDLLELAKAGRLTEIQGVGKGIADVLTDLLIHQKTQLIEDLRASIPPGLIELTQVSGLGPKKAMQLIEDLQIQTLSELEYACRENRLVKIKGFGAKLQEKILEGIHFIRSTSGQVRISEALEVSEKLVPLLKEWTAASQVMETGALRRRLEVLTELDFLTVTQAGGAPGPDVLQKLDRWKSEEKWNVTIRLHGTDEKSLGWNWAKLTASDDHWAALGRPEKFQAKSEEEFYDKLGLPWIAPEARETGEEVRLAKSGGLLGLVEASAIQGVFHNHTTRSDGVDGIEDLVREARRLGYRYIGISDHSQSAVYAQGLKESDLEEQEKEVRAVQEKFPDVKIFWGIESDILADGRLDYPKHWLDRFDFVIASIHSRFQMDRAAMTDRIVNAIRNPATSMLGHATGRLLLGRKGYDVDMEKIIQEAADHRVAIEINANPHRLDIDWRWGNALRQAGTSVCINPDAHAKAELSYTRYGIAVARKALLTEKSIWNTRSASEVAALL